MFFVVIRKSKLQSLITEASDTLANTCFKLGYQMGRIESANRFYLGMLDRPETLVERQILLILEKEEDLKNGNNPHPQS